MGTPSLRRHLESIRDIGQLGLFIHPLPWHPTSAASPRYIWICLPVFAPDHHSTDPKSVQEPLIGYEWTVIRPAQFLGNLLETTAPNLAILKGTVHSRAP